MERIYTKLALYGSKNECAKPDTVFLPISEVCDCTVSLINVILSYKTDKEIRCQKYIIVREEMVACNMVTVIFLVL